MPVFDLFTQSAMLFVGVASLFGLLVGSFLNVVIHRVPRMLEREWQAQCAWAEGKTRAVAAPYNLFLPASTCPHCGHLIRWYENVPVLSWLFLRGRCAQCGGRIAWRYPLVELVCGLLFAAAAWQWGVRVEVLWVWGLLATLLALTFIDFDTHLLPDNMTLPLAWAGLLANLSGGFVPLDEAVIGAVAGYLSLWSVYHVFRLLTGKEGMGFGDFKLLAALGAWLGWKMLLPVILMASLSGAIIGIALIALRRHQQDQPMPFGPWLAFGGVVAVFWGDAIVSAWLG